MSILAAFKIYLQTMGYSQSTQKTLGYYLQEFLTIMEINRVSDLRKISPHNIQEYYIYLSQRPSKNSLGGLSATTLNGHIFALRTFFVYVEKIDLILSNPMSVLDFPTLSSEPRQILTKSQIIVLYQACETVQERGILGLFYGCGLRRNEGEKLNIRDLDFRNNLLYVRSGKGKKRRVIPLSNGVSQDLKDYLYHQRPYQVSRQTKKEDKKAFMLNKKGGRMRGRVYGIYLKTILKRTTLSPLISLHSLRHSIATHLLEGGLKIEQVRDFLGHEFMESTQIYTRVDTTKIIL